MSVCKGMMAMYLMQCRQAGRHVHVHVHAYTYTYTYTYTCHQCTRTCMYVLSIEGQRDGRGGAGGQTDGRIRPSVHSPIKHPSNPRSKWDRRTDTYRIMTYTGTGMQPAPPTQAGRQVVMHDGRVGGEGEGGWGRGVCECSVPRSAKCEVNQARKGLEVYVGDELAKQGRAHAGQDRQLLIRERERGRGGENQQGGSG